MAQAVVSPLSPIQQSGVRALNPPDLIIATRAPLTTDYQFFVGTIWVRLNTGSYILVGKPLNVANWQTSSQAGDLDTINSLTPTAGNIDIVGTADQIDVANAGSTVTLSLPDPVIAPGDLEITGTLDVAGLTTLAALTQAGTLSLNATGAATTTIGSASAGNIAIDTTGFVTINADAASSFTVTDASADLTLSSTLGSVNITAGESAADSIVISSAIGGIDILAAGASAGEDIDITATGSSVNIVSTEAGVLNAIRLNASAADGGIDVDCGTGGITVDSTGAFSIDGAASSNVTVTGAGVDLTLSSVLGSVKINSTEDAAGAIALSANGGTSETITVVAAQGTGVASISLSSTAGGVTIAGGLASADAINITAAAGGVDVDGALQVNIASSQNAADAVRILASAGGIDVDAVGAAGEDIVITNTGGSISLVATEAAGDAIVIQASDAAGGIDLIAGTGAVSCTGNFTFTTAGNKINSTSVATNGTAGANSFGSVTLSGGTATVSTTAITTNSLVFLTRQTIGATGAAALGMISRGTIVNGVSFVINSLLTADATNLATTDVSNVAWFIVN